MLERPLKSIITSQLEETLSKSISELVGAQYSVSIENIDFECGNGAAASLFDSVDMKIHISKEQNNDSEES